MWLALQGHQAGRAGSLSHSAWGAREAGELRPGERVGGHGVGRAEASGGRERGWLPGTSEESSQVLESLYIVPRTWKVSLGTAVEGDHGLPLWAP